MKRFIPPLLSLAYLAPNNAMSSSVWFVGNTHPCQITSSVKSLKREIAFAAVGFLVVEAVLSPSTSKASTTPSSRCANIKAAIPKDFPASSSSASPWPSPPPPTNSSPSSTAWLSTTPDYNLIVLTNSGWTRPRRFPSLSCRKYTTAWRWLSHPLFYPPKR